MNLGLETEIDWKELTPELARTLADDKPIECMLQVITYMANRGQTDAVFLSKMDAAQPFQVRAEHIESMRKDGWQIEEEEIEEKDKKITRWTVTW